MRQDEKWQDYVKKKAPQFQTNFRWRKTHIGEKNPDGPPGAKYFQEAWQNRKAMREIRNLRVSDFTKGTFASDPRPEDVQRSSKEDYIRAKPGLRKGRRLRDMSPIFYGKKSSNRFLK